MNDARQKVIIKLVQVGNKPDTIRTILAKIQGLRDTPEALMSHAPCAISGKVPFAIAEKVKDYLEQAGATVVLAADERPAPPNAAASAPSGTVFERLTSHLAAAQVDGDAATLDAINTGDYGEETITSFEPVAPVDVEPEPTAPATPETPEASEAPLNKPTWYVPPSPKKASGFPQELEAAYADEMPEPEPIGKKPRRAAQRSGMNLPVIVGLLLLAALMGGGAWFYLSGRNGGGAGQSGQTPGLGNVGRLDLENPDEANILLLYVAGTRVTEPVALQGSTINLPRGDYYVEARKGSQMMRYPVYIKGRGHRVTVRATFPTTVIPAHTAYIPEGWFRMGNKETEIAHFGFPDEKPDIDVYLSAYLISKYEVTNREYAEFVEAGGYDKEIYWDSLLTDWPSLVSQVPDYGRVYGADGWNAVRQYLRRRFIDTDGRPGPRLWENDIPPYEDGQDDYPVTGITLYEADAYCVWLTQKAGKVHRLPTEAEWEKAARSYEGYFFSYGNEYDPTRANTETIGPKKVGSYPPNGFGVYDLTGNLWEWVADLYRDDAYRYLSATYKNDIRNPRIFNAAEPYGRRIVRGGSFRSVNRVNAKATIRYPMYPNEWHTNIGFRYVTTP